MGVTVNKRKSTGDFYVWVCQNKRRTARKVGRSRKLANEIANEYRKQLLLGTFEWSKGKRLNPTTTFREFTKTYLNAAKARLKRNSWESYQTIINAYLLPYWGNKSFDSITKQDIRNLLLNYQSKGLVTNNIRITISALLQYAVEEEIIPSNLCHNLGKEFTRRVPKTLPQVLSKEQTQQFLQAIQQHRSQYYAFFLLAFRTGLRLGELLALRWQDIDLNSKKIKVCRSFSHGRFDTPKTNRVRIIDMSNQLHTTLQEYQLQVKSKENDLLFQSKNGGPSSARKIRSTFYFILTKTELPRIRIQDIRHSFASQLIQEGSPITYVSAILGHSTPMTTLTIYSHLIPTVSNQKFLDKLDEPQL